MFKSTRRLWIFPLLAIIFKWTGGSPTGVGTEDNDLNRWWEEVSGQYPKYNNMTQLIHEMEEKYPDLINVYTVGKSVEGREMWVVNLRMNVQKPRKLLQPPMKIIANMHGDETVGRAVVLMLVVDLIRKFRENNPR